MAQPNATLIPVGKQKGRAVASLPSAFLHWWVAQDVLRFRYVETTRAILCELAARYADFERLVDELRVDQRPPDRGNEAKAALRARRALIAENGEDISGLV